MKKIVLISLLSLIFVSAFSQGLIDYGSGYPRTYNVMRYGAKGDGIIVYDCATTAGSTTVTSATASFNAATDVGKIIHIDSAGVSHARLTDTIASVTNSTTVVIKHNATFSTTTQMMDYGTDDVPFIQAAIQAAFNANGGVVWFPVPKGQFYDLASPYVTSVDGINPNCQLYIPLDTGRMNGRTIELHGEVPPFFPQSGQLTTPANPTLKGIVLYSTVTSGSGLPYIIGSSYYNNGFSNSNWATGVFINLCLRSYNGCTRHPVAGNRLGINLTNLSKSYGDQIMIDNSCPPESSVAPLSTVGITGPAVFNFAEHDWGRVFISGYETGVSLGEHQHYDYLTVISSKYGIQMLNGSAMASVTYFQCENMQYGVRMASGTGNYLFITNYVPEHDTRPTWAAFVQDVYIDASISKQVTILATQIGGTPTTFSTNDPSKCKIKYVNQGTTETVDIDNWTQTLTDSVSGTMTIDLYGGRKAKWTFGAGNRTISAFNNMGAGDEMILFVQQDGTGSRTLTFPGTTKISGTLASGANAWSRIVVDYDGTTYFITITNPT